MSRPVGAIPSIEYIERLIQHSKDTETIIPIYYVHDLEENSYLSVYYITPETYIYFSNNTDGPFPFIKWSRMGTNNKMYKTSASFNDMNLAYGDTDYRNGYNNHFIFDIGFMANDYLETCLSPVLLLEFVIALTVLTGVVDGL